MVKRLEQSLTHRISEKFERYRESARALGAFLNDVSGSFGALEKQHGDLLKKIEATLKSSRPEVEESSSPGSKRLVLTGAELGVIKRVLDQKRELMQNYPDLLSRLCFIYYVALFDSFISDAFLIVMTSRPEVLRTSKKQLSYENILKFQKNGDLISFMAEREMNEISYKSIHEQAQYYRDRFGIDLDQSGTTTARLAQIRAARNVLVHNGGIVNLPYLEMVPDSPHSLGGIITLTSSEVHSAGRDLGATASFVRNAIVEKFERPSPKSPAIGDRNVPGDGS